MTAYPYETEQPHSAIKGAKLARAIQRFEQQHQQHRYSGGQLVVRYRGRVVANRALGTAASLAAEKEEEAAPLVITPATPFPVYSAGKPMTALCIALLEERGLLQRETPVADLLPEFGQQGKAKITIEEVLTHRAGIIMPELWQALMDGRTEAEVWELICAAKPAYPRGTFAYMPGEFGWILARVVKQIDGRDLPLFFREEFAQPLGLTGMTYGLDQHRPDEVVLSRWLGKPEEWVAGANAADYFEEAQTRQIVFQSMNPAFCMVSNAASLAAFYEFLLNGGVDRNRQRLLNETTLARYLSRQVRGWNKSLKTYLAISRGFMLGTLTPSSYGWWNSGRCFGHAGAFSSLAFGDGSSGLSIAIVTNGNAGIGDFFRRFIPLAQALRTTVKL